MTTSNAACVILDECVKIIGPKIDDVISIQNHPDRTNLLNDGMFEINFNENAVFYCGKLPIRLIAEYTKTVTNDDFGPCVTFYPEDTVEKAMSEDDADSNIIECSDVVHKNLTTLYRNYTLEEVFRAQHYENACNSVIDGMAVARLITVGIAASRIPADINLIKTTTSKDVSSIAQKRVYDKLHKVVRSVNSRIAKSIRKKQTKAAFQAHAHLWHAAAKLGERRRVKKAYENFRQVCEAAHV